MPGQKTGTLTEEVRSLTGLGEIPVVAVAGHDTGSAVAGTQLSGNDTAYLSSGTWSLMGIESREPIISERSFELNFTNEGGIEGTIRVLKNICGMWLLERSRAEWEEMSYSSLIAQAEAAEPFRSLINPDAPCFANPKSMIEAIDSYCKATDQPTPQSTGEYVRCIFESLALRYRQVTQMLGEFSPEPLRKMIVIGGGARNNMLNQYTANATNLTVETGSSEATALGNVMMQAKWAGVVASIEQMREMIVQSLPERQIFTPCDKAQWDEAYEKYLTIYREL